jgi:hypothetical protein
MTNTLCIHDVFSIGTTEKRVKFPFTDPDIGLIGVHGQAEVGGPFVQIGAPRLEKLKETNNSRKGRHAPERFSRKCLSRKEELVESAPICTKGPPTPIRASRREIGHVLLAYSASDLDQTHGGTRVFTWLEALACRRMPVL